MSARGPRGHFGGRKHGEITDDARQMDDWFHSLPVAKQIIIITTLRISPRSCYKKENTSRFDCGVTPISPSAPCSRTMSTNTTERNVSLFSLGAVAFSCRLPSPSHSSTAREVSRANRDEHLRRVPAVKLRRQTMIWYLMNKIFAGLSGQCVQCFKTLPVRGSEKTAFES